MGSILQITPLGPPPWPTLDPFLFCVHHLDLYPKGNNNLGPEASLAHRNIGSDFSNRDGWSMYHGDTVPGFPRHPHRGFETITVARQGYIDHSDSLGATARLGQGDLQWMTAGKGIVHSEMFPLVNKEDHNPTELFQIWLNLPKRSKMVDPYFTMFWSEEIPVVSIDDAVITLYTGNLGDHKTLSPPPHSWASQANSDIAVWSIKLKANGRFTLPKSNILSNRCLYFFSGETLEIENRKISVKNRITLHSLSHVDIQNGSLPAEILLLQGNPIGEPTVQYGPFVMNTHQEIRQAIHDYQRTGFGGWPWERKDPVHNVNSGRFAIHADGKKEERK